MKVEKYMYSFIAQENKISNMFFFKKKKVKDRFQSLLPKQYSVIGSLSNPVRPDKPR